ncbi:pentapeptide repeat-containing protein [Cucumibacter marinus]|uniref:pentapeptide repeat-containing protein n=1 Tax=Cucumibacter marinus TaxID=1121252 RepID=UPI0004299E96|nr:pentapeptide repeat-containing protein [Cucumibacter marinus]
MGMVSRVNGWFRVLMELLRHVREEAGWANRAILGIVATLMGLAADILTPWLDVLGWMFPAALGLTIVGVGIWWLMRGRGAEPRPMGRGRRLAATGAIYGIVFTLVLAPIFLLNVTLGGTNGALAEISPSARDFQTFLGERFDRLDRALAVLNENVEEQGRDVQAVRETMEFSVAMDLIDRARETRDGSNQGQGIAISTLMDNGFDFIGSDFSGVALRNAPIDGVNFSEARLHFLDVRNASLKGANFSGSGLRFALAEGADFTDADLSGSFSPFFEGKGAIMAGANLSKANFQAADLRDVDFSGADLSGAAFAYADLRGANLSGADLTGAYLIGTLLNGANLDGAVFSETSMLAAVVDNGALSVEQRAGACRHESARLSARIELIEEWESDRFSTGLEFDDINTYDAYFPVPGLDDKSLPECSTPTDGAIAFDANYPDYMRIHLNREYLGQAGRRSASLQRFNAFRERLAEGQEQGVLLTASGE